MRTSTLFTVLFTTICVMACSSGSSGAADSSSFVSQYCAITAPCCEKQGRKPDQAKCEQFYSLFTAQAQYDAAKGQQCLDASRADPAICEGGSPATSEACKGVFKESSSSSGTKQPGETCEGDDECAASNEGTVECSFLSKDGATIRKCQLQVRAKENDECTGDKRVDSDFISGGSSEADRVGICWEEDALYCDFREKRCLRRIAVGDPCESFSSECVSGARCDSTSSRTCVALKAAGEACEPSVTSFEGPCQDKLFCDEGSKTCKPVLAPGSPCTKDVECRPGSCTNGKCSGGSSSTLTICAD